FVPDEAGPGRGTGLFAGERVGSTGAGGHLYDRGRDLVEDADGGALGRREFSARFHWSWRRGARASEMLSLEMLHRVTGGHAGHEERDDHRHTASAHAPVPMRRAAISERVSHGRSLAATAASDPLLRARSQRRQLSVTLRTSVFVTHQD